MKTINVTIKGVLPLLQHKMPLSTEKALKEKSKTKIGANKGDNPADYLYTDSTGNVCQPSEHIYQAIIKRLSNFQIVGRGKKTYKELGIGCIRVMPDMIVHKNQKWGVDERTCVINRSRVVRLRPKLEDWELDFQISVINEDMPVDVIKKCLDIAGAEGGIGDYRPRFGLFMVTRFEEI